MGILFSSLTCSFSQAGCCADAEEKIKRRMAEDMSDFIISKFL